MKKPLAVLAAVAATFTLSAARADDMKKDQMDKMEKKGEAMKKDGMMKKDEMKKGAMTKKDEMKKDDMMKK